MRDKIVISSEICLNKDIDPVLRDMRSTNGKAIDSFDRTRT